MAKSRTPVFIKENCRYFQIAGISVCVGSDLDLKKVKFKDELNVFAVDGPGTDNITIYHQFDMPDISGKDFGKELYRQPPWAISFKDGTWCYKGIMPHGDESTLHRLAFFNADHTCGTIYSPKFQQDIILQNGFDSLSLFPTDQIWLGRLLPARNAILLHSAAAIIDGNGFLFVGHSSAGKSTTMELLKTARKEKNLDVEILCDDRNIVRKGANGWHLFGTWSHGDVADVSAANVPLRAILFLEQASTNKIEHIVDRKAVWRKLLATLIRPMVTADWWEKQLDVLQRFVNEIPCYTMHFDKTGAVVEELQRQLIHE